MRFQINHFKFLVLYKQRRKIENSRRCDTCNIDIQRASFAKHLRIKKHSEKEKHGALVISEWLFQEPIESNLRKM